MFPFIPRTQSVELDGLPLWAIIGILAANALALAVCVWGLALAWRDWRKGEEVSRPWRWWEYWAPGVVALGALAAVVWFIWRLCQ